MEILAFGLALAQQWYCGNNVLSLPNGDMEKNKRILKVRDFSSREYKGNKGKNYVTMERFERLS